jgi:hypothetical protein
VWDRLFWALLAGLGPALLFMWLRHLRELGQSQRSTYEALLLTALFAFGSPYYYVSVQGTVWFAAHVVATIVLGIYLLAATRARAPLLAGCALGLAFLTRGPPVALFALFFVFQALAEARAPAAQASGEAERLAELLCLTRVRQALPSLIRFALPAAAALAIAMWMNAARFDDPFEFGHSHLAIRWKSRIETWGLFNYHYVARNLAVLLAALPWISAVPPYLKISRHGLALWVTTPQLWLVLWPKRRSVLISSLGLSAFAIALFELFYQNSGWIQFGYRFGLDYAPALFGLLALGGHRFGKLFHALALYAFAINLFGAITFDRDDRFYDNDSTQRVIFQPD